MFSLRKINVFSVITFSVMLLLVLPDLLQHGMFMDGTQYACVAKNLANGKGTFWFPFLSESWVKSGSHNFLEHPPLVYFIQSIFFKVFGDGIYTERIYCFVAMMACSFFIYRIWKVMNSENNELKSNGWLPVLFWIITPSVFWAFRNNLIENTLTVFILASVYFALLAIKQDGKKYLFIIISGIFIFLATLSKGIPGLFPVIILIIYYFVLNQISLRQTIVFTLLLILVPFIIYCGLILFNENANSSLRFYFVERLMKRIESGHLVENRFTILWWLFTDLLVPIGVTIMFILTVGFKEIVSKINSENKKKSFFFFLIGLAGVVPLTLTHVQRATYFVPAMPFFALAFSFILSEGMNNRISNIKNKLLTVLRISSLVLLVVSLIYCFFIFGKTSRDVKEISDVHIIGKVIPENSHIAVPGNIYNNWDFQLYLLRYHNITLDDVVDNNHEYYLEEKNAPIYDQKNLATMNTELSEYVLFSKKK